MCKRDAVLRSGSPSRFEPVALALHKGAPSHLLIRARLRSRRLSRYAAGWTALIERERKSPTQSRTGEESNMKRVKEWLNERSESASARLGLLDGIYVGAS